MYNPKSKHAEEFICDEEIRATLAYAKEHKNDAAELEKILQQAETYKGLDYRQVAVLLECDDPQWVTRIHELAAKIKQHIYGNRIVMFAPLYLSNYCVNEIGRASCRERV
mgnify:CR=1 FL=1